MFVNETKIDRTGLVGEWLLDGNALDTSGNGNDGTASNMTWVSADRGYVKEQGSFNGTNSDITIVGSDVGAVFTYNLWFNTSQASVSLFFDNAVSFDNRSAIVLNQDYTGATVSGQFTFFGNNGTTSSRLGPTSNPNINDGNWHMITWTRDGSNINTIYIDGKNVVSTGSIPSGDITSTTIHLGKFFDNSFYYNGDLGLFRLYDSVITATEINILYNEGLRRLGPSNAILSGNFPKYSLDHLEEGKVLEISRPQSGGSYIDQSGNGNNGTPTNVTDSTSGLYNLMDFNGTTSVVTLPSTAFTSGGTNTFSFCCTAKFDTTTSNRSLLMGFTTGTGIACYYSANLLVFSKPNLVDLIVSYTPPIGKYIRLQFIADNSGMRIYVDNELIGSNSNTANFTATTSTIGIGAYILGSVLQPSFYFDGEIVSPIIYNRALSENERVEDFYSTKIV